CSPPRSAPAGSPPVVRSRGPPNRARRRGPHRGSRSGTRIPAPGRAVRRGSCPESFRPSPWTVTINPGEAESENEDGSPEDRHVEPGDVLGSRVHDWDVLFRFGFTDERLLPAQPAHAVRDEGGVQAE